jgi:alpha-beta hydrolase superfamily lysophospholipase
MKNPITLLTLFASLSLLSCQSNSLLNATATNPAQVSAQVSAQGLIFDNPPAGWGSLSQVAATYDELLDLQGNRDGIWENESDPAGTVKGIGTTLPLKPWLDKASEYLKGIHLKTHLTALESFMAQNKQRWQQPATRVASSQLKNPALFEAQKTLLLSRLGRTPAEITEGFVRAEGRVMGQTIAPRNVFWQRFRPIGRANGKVVVLSPGFQETGRNFIEQVQALNKQGFDVVVMDHQWAGQTQGGQPGGLDRGFGVARDVAAVAAYAQAEIVKKDYAQSPQAELILFGNSMGAGPGVLAAMTLNDQNQLQLSGPAMPQGLRALVQAPFLDASPGILNRVLAILSKLPLANTLKLFSSGMPVLTYDKVAAQKGTQVILQEDIRAQLQTMSAANTDLQTLRQMIDKGQGPKGQIRIVHGNRDPLADPAQSQWLKNRLGNQVQLRLIDSPNHVLEQNPREQQYAIEEMLQFLK